MLSTRKLIRMARKWQTKAKASRKMISLARSLSRSASRSTSSSVLAEKGHFVIYTWDETRFAIPLTFLQSEIFRELLRLAEEEFGLSSDGPITLPCDSIFMEYAISIIQGHVSRKVEEAVILSLSTFACSSSSSSANDLLQHERSLPAISCS